MPGQCPIVTELSRLESCRGACEIHQRRDNELPSRGRHQVQEGMVSHHTACQGVYVVFEAPGFCPAQVHHLLDKRHLPQDLLIQE